MIIAGREINGNYIVYGVVAVLALIAMGLSVFTVKEYERDVVTRLGKFSRVAEPGLNFKIPFIENAYTYRTDILSFAPDKQVNTYTIDNQEVDVIFTVFYRVPPGNVQFIYTNAQDYKERLFNIALDRLKSEMGKVNVAHVSERRGQLRDAIKEVLVNDSKVLGVEVTDFQLTNIEYTKAYKSEVEKAAAARQVIATREHEKDQEIQVAERARVQAKGVADSTLMKAEAEAKAIQLRGEAEAAAIRAQAEALKQNTGLVELRKAEKWNGALPQQMLSSVVPFMNFNPPGAK